MNAEDLNPVILYYSITLFFVGLACLFHHVILSKKTPSIGHEFKLDPWRIRGLDLALFLTFIFLFISGAGAITLEGYKIIFNTEVIPDEHSFVFGYPMHIAILVSLYGFFRYYKQGNDVPLNPVRQGLTTLILRSIYFFFAAIPILLAGGYIWPILLEFLNLPTDPQDLVTQVEEMGISPVLFFVAFLAVVVAPISEELLFRAFIYRSLKTYVSPTLSAVLTSLMFAGMHLNLLSFLPLFLLGLWLCRTYEKTGNIFVPIIFHGLFNGNTLLVLMLIST
ncbi:MAG: type II CAAX endopeptidase family protein [Verrucomicrobia bacterium]|nr:type II CAAX endopeptidase family protein [Verrucomicrobiota bacterium]